MRSMVATVLLVVAACSSGGGGGGGGGAKDKPVSNHADAAVSSVARDRGVELTASSRGAVLVLVFRNVGTAPIDFMTHVFGASRPNYDWLDLTVTDPAGKPRKMVLMGNRSESGPMAVTIEPGKDAMVEIDLAIWAKDDPGNKNAPLASGRHQVKGIWNTTDEWRGKDGTYWGGRLEFAVALDVP